MAIRGLNDAVVRIRRKTICLGHYDHHALTLEVGGPSGFSHELDYVVKKACVECAV